MQFKKFPTVLAAFVVGGTIFPTLASADSGSEPQCVTQPATVTVVETTNSSSTSTTHIHVEVKKTTREQVKQFETAHNVIIAIRQRPNGIKSSKHCKDPVKAGWIKPGQPFTNRRHDHSKFTDSWQNGRKICDFKIIHRGGKTIAKGTKNNCGNEDIEIVIHGSKPKPQTRQVLEFRTVGEFRSVYDKWITETNQSSSTATGSFSMQYSCAPGWDLIEDSWGNHLCRKCEQKSQPPVVTPPKPPTIAVTCLTNHDVFSGGQIDLEIKAVKSDGTQPVLAPSDIEIWTDEGNMMDGTKHTYTDTTGTYWVQRWQAPLTTIIHTVTWHATVKGAAQPCSGVNNVVAD
jgi:hypothetical protein